jgi:hypothetical protein
MEFQFFRVKAKLASVNVRQELHGEDRVLALDIGVEFDQGNYSLDKLDPLLLTSLFWENTAERKQADLEGVEPPSIVPNLRFASLTQPLKWDEEFSDGAFTIHHGDDPMHDIRLTDVDIGKIRFTAKEGGTVQWAVRIQCHPDEADVARVCALLQSEVTVTIDTDPEDDEAIEPPADEQPKRGARKGKQTDAFDDARVQDIKDAMTASEGASQ